MAAGGGTAPFTVPSHSRTGRGEPVVCVTGGPLLPASYLGTLGGLDRHAELILFDPARDTGTDPDPAAARCDALARRLEDLRRHL